MNSGTLARDAKSMTPRVLCFLGPGPDFHHCVLIPCALLLLLIPTVTASWGLVILQVPDHPRDCDAIALMLSVHTEALSGEVACLRSLTPLASA